jgi:hypothetical protein
MKYADIQKLHEVGLITDEQRQKIVSHFQLKEEGGGKFLAIVSTIGAVLITTGIILLISAHWNEIPRGVKIAAGLALMLGFALPYNFAVPYRAANLRDFWRRWHMTLSRFLRDYLYIPLGGNRHGLAAQLAALMATMALGGLWHGAGWGFVLWGCLHGLGLCACVLWQRAGRSMPAPIGWVCVMIFLFVTWIFFRAPSIAAAWQILVALFGHAPGRIAGVNTLLIAAGVALLGPASQTLVGKLRPLPWLAPAAALATLVLLFKLGDGPAYEFIYFRF